LAAAASSIFLAQKAYQKCIYHDSVLTGRGWLDELLEGNDIRFKDQLGMAKHVAERFQRSGDTISRVFNRIVNALTSKAFYGAHIKLPDPNIVPLEIESNPKLYPFLNDCLGAVDGTHITVCPPAEE
ncbi:hypothetical protein M422DRAFT_150220, partial [Sphaerobolus stellatus SS14]